jgi:hypothetical protein
LDAVGWCRARLANDAWGLEGSLAIDTYADRGTRVRPSTTDPPNTRTTLWDEQISCLYTPQPKDSRTGTIGVTSTEASHAREVSGTETLYSVTNGPPTSALDSNLVAGDVRTTIDVCAVSLKANDGWTKSCKLVI